MFRLLLLAVSRLLQPPPTRWHQDDTSSAAARFRLVEETRGGVEGKVFTLLEGADVPRVDVRRRVVMIIFIYRNLVTQKGVI